MPQSESSYRSTYLEPKVLKPLSYPYDDYEYVKRESDARYTIYAGTFELDYLFLIDENPALVIEAKSSERDFDNGLGEGKQHAIHYNDNKPGFEGRVVPFLLVAADKRVTMYEARVSAFGISYEPLASVLSWQNLCTHVRRIFAKAPPHEEIENPAVAPIFTNIFEDIFKGLKSTGRPKYTDGKAVVILNELLLANIHQKRRIFDKVIVKYKIPVRVAAKIANIFSRYDLTTLEGPALAFAYRQFVAAYFHGLGATKTGQKQLARTGRYLTPSEVIEFMVKLAKPKINELIIDPACGTGGFLGAILASFPEAERGNFASRNLVGCDIDPFCAAAAKTFLDLLIPGEQTDLKIYHHNGLYAENWNGFSDISCEFKSNSFDLVIGNPPANALYSGGPDAEYVAERLNLPINFNDGEAFLMRALDLCAPGGRVVVVAPDGLLANTRGAQDLRNTALQKFVPVAIVSLPRIFPYVSSKMSIIYLENSAKRARKRQIFMARVEIDTDPKTGIRRILGNEFDAILKEFQS